MQRFRNRCKTDAAIISVGIYTAPNLKRHKSGVASIFLTTILGSLKG